MFLLKPSIITVSEMATIEQGSQQQQADYSQTIATLPIFAQNNLLLNSIRPDEDPITFAYRSEYSRVAKELLGNQLTNETALILGQMAAQRARTGVTYPQQYEQLLQYLDQLILNS